MTVLKKFRRIKQCLTCIPSAVSHIAKRSAQLIDIGGKIQLLSDQLLANQSKLDLTNNQIIDLHQQLLQTDTQTKLTQQNMQKLQNQLSGMDHEAHLTHEKIIAMDNILNLSNHKINNIIKMLSHDSNNKIGDCFQTTHAGFNLKNLAQDDEVYVNYAPQEPIPEPKPITHITHKYTNELVPHYNFAANFPPHAPLPYDLKHVIATIPGSGTHMVVKALTMLGEAHPYATHLFYPIQSSQLTSSDFYNVKKIIMIRDPRDNIYSRLGFKVKESNGERHELLKKVISEEIFYSILQMYESLFHFLMIPNVLFVRFEDMIDHQKKDTERYSPREKTLITIGNFINLPLNDSIIHHTADHLPGDTWNYEPGEHTNYWRNHFDRDTIELFKQNIGTLVTRLGYETDDNW